jgi:hypothetical protein
MVKKGIYSTTDHPRYAGSCAYGRRVRSSQEVPSHTRLQAECKVRKTLALCSTTCAHPCAQPHAPRNNGMAWRVETLLLLAQHPACCPSSRSLLVPESTGNFPSTVTAVSRAQCHTSRLSHSQTMCDKSGRPSITDSSLLRMATQCSYGAAAADAAAAPVTTTVSLAQTADNTQPQPVTSSTPHRHGHRLTNTLQLIPLMQIHLLPCRTS